MAALNHQLTEDEARQLINQWRSMTSIPSFYDMLVEALQEPTPHKVYYEPVRGKPVYVPQSHFYCRTIFRSPSDCDWIVPGTHEKDF